MRRRRQQRDLTPFITDWWLRCIRDGSQLLDRSVVEQNYDVVGEGPWYRYVSVDALWRDFCNTTGIHCRKRDFKKRYMVVTGEETLVTRTGVIPVDTNGLRASAAMEYVGYGKTPLTRLR